jgi:hypothetical protein
MGMSDEQPPPSREERLAAKLRENLRRRKAQTRELGARALHGEDRALPKSEERR